MNTDDILREVQEAIAKVEVGKLPEDDDGLTMLEFADAWGVSRTVANERLRKLHRAGMLVCGRRYIQAMNGIMKPVPVYQIKDE